MQPPQRQMRNCTREARTLPQTNLNNKHINKLLPTINTITPCIVAQLPADMKWSGRRVQHDWAATRHVSVNEGQELHHVCVSWQTR